MSLIKAYAAKSESSHLTAFEYEPGELAAEEVEVKVHSCGICHSDVSMLRNNWANTTYPLVPGHEIVGEVIAKGSMVKNLQLGERVGIGWFSGSCMTCNSCLRGDHNMCSSVESTIVGRHGGFADRVRSHYSWAIPLPKKIESIHAGPLFCGGITVFNPLVQFNVKPTDRVGVVGIGGLGHMALQFLHRWGCHVTAFTSSKQKKEEAKQMGAHEVVSSNSDTELDELQGRFDFILVTANVTLNWEKYIAALAPRGRLHFVGAVLEAIPVQMFSLLMGQREISASPLGAPYQVKTMLDFCQRHDIKPVIETFPMSQVNEAIAHLEDGKARYRIVLENDF